MTFEEDIPGVECRPENAKKRLLEEAGGSEGVTLDEEVKKDLEAKSGAKQVKRRRSTARLLKRQRAKMVLSPRREGGKRRKRRMRNMFQRRRRKRKFLKMSWQMSSQFPSQIFSTMSRRLHWTRLLLSSQQSMWRLPRQSLRKPNPQLVSLCPRR